MGEGMAGGVKGMHERMSKIGVWQETWKGCIVEEFGERHERGIGKGG
jgi:hypothetical protein